MLNRFYASHNPNWITHSAVLYFDLKRKTWYRRAMFFDCWLKNAVQLTDFVSNYFGCVPFCSLDSDLMEYRPLTLMLVYSAECLCYVRHICLLLVLFLNTQSKFGACDILKNFFRLKIWKNRIENLVSWISATKIHWNAFGVFWSIFFFCFHQRKMTFVLCLLIFPIIFVPIHKAKRMKFASFFTASDTEIHRFCKQKHRRENWDNMNLIYSFDTLFSAFFSFFSIHLQFVGQRSKNWLQCDTVRAMFACSQHQMKSLFFILCWNISFSRLLQTQMNKPHVVSESNRVYYW